MSAVWICLALAVVLLVIGVLLCTGRGWFLVAGINTMAPAERDRYDVPKVCRATGIVALVCAALTGALAALTYLELQGRVDEGVMTAFVAVCIAVVAVSCGVLVWYTNKRCLKPPHPMDDGEKTE